MEPSIVILYETHISQLVLRVTIIFWLQFSEYATANYRQARQKIINKIGSVALQLAKEIEP